MNSNSAKTIKHLVSYTDDQKKFSHDVITFYDVLVHSDFICKLTA